MKDTITVTGVVGTTPTSVTLPGGLEVTEFRLASTRRRFDKEKDEWVDAETNWYTVKSYGRLGSNVAASVRSGQRILVVGRLRIRQWEKDGRRGQNIGIEADAIGHDLTWGTSEFSRPVRNSAATLDEDRFPDPEESDDLSADHAPTDADDVAVPF